MLQTIPYLWTTNIIMKTFFVSLLLASGIANSQHLIKFPDGGKIKAATYQVGDSLIAYTKAPKDKAERYLSRFEVSKIVDANGETKTLSMPVLTLEKAKFEAIRLIEKFGSEARFDDNLKAEFISDSKLQLTPWNVKKNKAAGDARIYDFSLIYKFELLDVKSDRLTILNIVTSGENEATDVEKKKRIRLLISVENQKNAAYLQGTLKELNRLLAAKYGNLPADSR